MTYYHKVLRPEEKVHFLGQLHWIIYNRAIGLLAVAIVFSLLKLDPVLNADCGIELSMIALAALVLAALDASSAAVRRQTTEIVVTDLRVITKIGLFARRSVEMNIGKIETVDVVQGFTGRMLGYGTVMIRGTGSGMEPLIRVADPIALRNAILVG